MLRRYCTGMAIGLDREKLLYAIGILLGVIAAAYFGFQLFDQVSVVTTAAVLFAGFLCFLLAGIGIDAELVDIVAYALAAGCYLVFVAYLLSRFDVGDGGTFLLLAASSALFIALGYLAQQDRLAIDRRRATVGIAVILLAAVALVGVDLVGAQATTSTTFEDTVEVPDRNERVAVGTVTVENEFFLPRDADIQRFEVCVYGPDVRPAMAEYDPPLEGSRIGGDRTRHHEILVPGRAFYTSNGTLREGFEGRETVPVETASRCPETTQEPKVVVAGRSQPPYR